jgi:hypothetical protein
VNITLFLGPEGFCAPNQEYFEPIFPEPNKYVYEKMMEIPLVSILYDRMTENRSHDNKWTGIDPFHAKFVIVLSAGQNILYNNFPHYYNLMDTLSSVRASPLKNKTFSNSWHLMELQLKPLGRPFIFYQISRGQVIPWSGIVKNKGQKP